MKNFLLFKITTFLSILIISAGLQSQSLLGDVEFWQKSDFLGFDEIGDCTGSTGDISSVFARTDGKALLIRITFDNMVSRKHNEMVKDNFSDQNISLKIKLTNQSTRSSIFDQAINLSELSIQKNTFIVLRTPSSNLWEAKIVLSESTNRENIEFSLAVLLDGKIVDYFLSDGRNSDAEGNCAFVHHGNQGITYTEVFYGSPGGQSGMDGSGFDEVLQVHEATNIPGNFHISGTLMPAAQWHNPEFNTWLRTLASEGKIEMMTSALGQHIMPFIHNNMNDWSVDIECDMVDFQYSYTPRTAWIPERVWLSPGAYPDAGVVDWLGDNWTQYGVWGIVLDDSPHLNGYDNRKIHWMNNASGIDLRVIPINNSFVGNMHYDANGAKNQIAGMGTYNICVYGTDWEVAAEMNEHDGTFFLDNYESVLWWCYDNYPGVNVWKLVDAMQNSNFNGTNAEITPGTYGLLGSTDGYGGSNNSWYTQWASTSSHSDFHEPKWNYGYIWDDAHNNLLTAPNNNLAQLAWYILMINLHETGWHDGGTVAGWEHRYSSHIKNANVYAEAARWADGQYETELAAYYNDIDHDGVDEVVIHNQDILAVFESIGGKANWLFYKDDLGNAHSVVGSDMAYWAETDGDYNDGSNNHVAALSDVYPYQQDAVYEIEIIENSGETVIVEFSQWGINKRIQLTEGVNYLDVKYDFFGGDGYVKSGFSPGLMDLMWSGKDHVQRMWGDYGSYCGQRNSSSGATVAIVMGDGGAQHNTQFEGTLVLGDEIKGNDQFFIRLFAGYTSDPTGTTVPELNTLAQQSMDVFPPTLNPIAFQVDNNTIELTFNEALEFNSAQNKDNYILQGFSGNYTIINTIRQNDWRKVRLTIQEYWEPGDEGEIEVTGVEDLNGNVISENNTATFLVPSGTTPHTIAIDGSNDFDSETELMTTEGYSLYITWDNTQLYIGFEEFDLNEGDLFVNIDTDQVTGSGASGGSWGRVIYPSQYRAEYQVAIEGGGGSIQLNNYTGGNWNYPGNSGCNSYEGWSGNGLTEISIPWASLGNPNGIALSVHVSEEENQIITSVFPTQNPIGNHPTLTHVYGFYIPYITSEMPVAGMEPNRACILPNESPEITSFSPEELFQTLLTGQSLDFSITASDPENDDLDYLWILDGELIAETQNYTLVALTELVGTHDLVGKVSDGFPGNDADSIVWQVEITQDEVLMADFTSNTTTVCLGEDILFSDISTGEIIEWNWYFEGGVPDSSTYQNPTISYAASGTYNVSLTVSDGIDSDTIIMLDYITVNENPVADAGEDLETCENVFVQLDGIAEKYSSVLWTSSGDGVFSNTTTTATEYTPGTGDATAGFAEITFTAFPFSPCPTAASDLMIITVLSAPVITTQPQSQNATEGSQVIFYVETEGSEPFDYLWFGPAGEIAGENTNQLILDNVTSEDNGNYYCTIENSCGTIESEIATLTIENLIIQTINIPSGWSGISTWLNPQNPMVEDIFSEIVLNEQLIVFQNYNFLYWPGQNINTIDLNGGWDYQSGYQIKVSGDQQLSISGNSTGNKTLIYNDAGWYLIPVLSDCEIAPEELFADVIDDVVIVKEVAGLKLFWPGVFQNLYFLEPGKSYTANFSAPVSFSYPDCNILKFESKTPTSGYNIQLKQTVPNPESHVLVLSDLATTCLIPGDKISIQSEDGFLFADILVKNPGKSIGLPIFADDATTSEKDGFESGDKIVIAIIRNNETFITAVMVNNNFDNLNLRKNGLTQIISLYFDNSLVNGEESIDFYPNPSKNILYFKGINGTSIIKVFSSHGDLIIRCEEGTQKLDVSMLDSGLYFVYFYKNNIPNIKKFVKQ